MLKLMCTAQVLSVHPPKMIQTMSTLMIPSWKFILLFCKIYNDCFALPRADFISSLSECCNCYEFCYICDMMVLIVK